MTSDDHRDQADDRDRTASGDPFRDLMLGLAAQIDQVAALFAGRATASTEGPDLAASGLAATGLAASGLAEVSGEITTLLAEIGDLLARLIAALIAVLEAIAKALRSTPAPAGPAPRYEPIAVHIDVSGSAGGPARPAPSDTDEDDR